LQFLALLNVGGGTLLKETNSDGSLVVCVGAGAGGVSAVRGGGRDQLDINHEYQDKEE
jgi:hypothetical protein